MDEYAEKILERKKQRRREQLAAWLMILPYLLIFIVFTVVPVVMGTGFSFMRYNPYDSTENAFFGFQNYINIFNFSLPISKTFWKSFSTMLLFDVICVPILMMLSLLIAYFVNKKPPLYKFFRAIIFYRALFRLALPALFSAICLRATARDCSTRGSERKSTGWAAYPLTAISFVGLSY